MRDYAKRDAHLDYVAPVDGNSREPNPQVQEDDHALSPTPTTATIVPSAHNASDHIPTEIILEAAPISSCSHLLYDYIRAAIFVNGDQFSDVVPVSERYGLCSYLDKQPTRELLRHGLSELLRAFVQWTLPKDDLYDVVRASGTADDLILLRRLLLVTKTDWKWGCFSEKLLFYAAQDGNECLLKMLIDFGVNINVRRAFGPQFLASHVIDVLQFATLAGNKKVIEILDKHGATIFTGWKFDDCAFIFDAMARNIGDLTKPLFARAANSNVSTVRKGIAVLLVAVQHSYDSIVSSLLEAGFNPYFELHKYPFQIEILDTHSAFMVALNAMKITYVKNFLKFPLHGLNKEHCQERLRQLTAAYVFARCSENIDLENAILEAGWRPDEVGLVLGYDFVLKYLSDVLEGAVESGDCNKVRCLTQMGANPNRPKIPGSEKRPLRLAIGRQDVVIVRQLIAAGADVNLSCSWEYETPLQEAAAMGSLEVLSLLVEAGANVNFCPGYMRDSAIAIAAKDGNLEMVTYLLKSGADIQGRHNRDYRKALYYRAERVSKVDSARTIKLHDRVESPYSFSVSPLPSTRMVRQDPIVELLQEWKRSHYGEQDCDTFENIFNSITWEEWYSS